MYSTQILFLICLAIFAAQGFPQAAPAAEVEDEDQRIIGGSIVTTRGKYPFIISFQRAYFKEDGTLDYASAFCGGSIINAEWILTAAHCLGQLTDDIYIAAGINNLDKDDEHTQRIKVDKIYLHPFYDGSYANVNDIMLMHLSKKLQFTSHVRPIAMAPSGYIPTGPAKVVGWGNHNDSGRIEHAIDLREVDGDVRPRKDCGWHQYYTEKLQVCFGKPNQTSCQGDSGGPLVQTTASGSYQQIGVVSYGFVGCVGHAIYTSVSAYVDSFINPIIAAHESVVAAEKAVDKGIQKAPFLVSVHFYPNVLSGLNKKICTGSIVEKRWVLTTARCLNLDETNGEGLYVIAGTSNPTDEDDVFSRRILKVAKVFKHPQADNQHLEHDVALLYLAEPLIMKSLLRKLNLPSDANYQPVGTVKTAQFILKGDSKYLPVKQNDLVTTTVELESVSECKKWHRELTEENSICTKAPKSDLCTLDIGGPLYDESQTIIGIATMKNNPCGLFPEFYEKITSDLNFIKQTMQDKLE